MTLNHPSKDNVGSNPTSPATKMKKFLLSDQVCHHCNGFGVFKEKYSAYRIRVHFQDYDNWHFLDDEYMNLDDAVWTALEMKHGNDGVLFEVVKPNGEIVSV